MKLFENKVVVITGGARGIGKTTAFAFGREGAKVIFCDINKRQGRETERELREEKNDAFFLYTDLSQKKSASDLVGKVVGKFGKIDILINNARSGKRTGLFEETYETWEECLGVTLKAAFFLSQQAIRQMGKTGGGSIVNISSNEALFVGQDGPSYHIAKAGMIQMTRYLAVYGGKYGVRANAVLPGFIIQDEYKKKFQKKENERYRQIARFCHPLGQTGDSSDVAYAVLYLSSAQAKYISGQYLIIDGGLSVGEHSKLIYDFDNSNKNNEI